MIRSYLKMFRNDLEKTKDEFGSIEKVHIVIPKLSQILWVYQNQFKKFFQDMND